MFLVHIYRLFHQSVRKSTYHISTELVRSVNNAVQFNIIERRSNYLTVAKDMMTLNNRLLDSEEYSPIDISTYMDFSKHNGEVQVYL